MSVTVTNVIESVPIYAAPVKSGDSLLYGQLADAVAKTSGTGSGPRIDFYGTAETGANTVALKTWMNIITGDYFYAPANKLPPYDCYIEVTANVLPRVLAAGTGAFDVHLYLNAAGTTQLVGTETAKSLDLAGHGYIDMGVMFASAAPLGGMTSTNAAIFG